MFDYILEYVINVKKFDESNLVFIVALFYLINIIKLPSSSFLNGYGKYNFNTFHNMFNYNFNYMLSYILIS